MADTQKTSKDVGNSLFRDLLDRGSKSLFSAQGGLFLSTSKGKNVGVSKEKNDRTSNALEMLQDALKGLGMPVSQLRLPASGTQQLIQIMEKQGLSRERIDQWILSCRDKDGMIHMGRLMARLQREGLGEKGAESHLVVAAGKVPEVQSVLLQMGFTIEDVKKMMENAVNGKGELSLAKLSGTIGKQIPDAPSERQWAALLGTHGITSRPGKTDKMFHDPTLKETIKGFADAPSEEVQQGIKQNIAELLRQKGVPPQEVKSFLENLSVQYSKDILKTEHAVLNARGKGVAETEAANILTQVVIKAQPEWSKGEWRTKIMELLRQETLGGSAGKPTEGFREDGSTLQITFSEMIKGGDARPKDAFLQAMAAHGDGERANSKGKEGNSLGKENERNHHSKAFVEIKDTAGNGILGIRAGKESQEGTPIQTVKGANSLPDPLPKIFDKLIFMARGGEQRGSIHISPPELGRLDMEIVVKQGNLQAHLNAENPLVKEIIEANLGQLKQQLADQGFFVGKFDVTVGRDPRQQGDGDDRNAGRGGRGPGHPRTITESLPLDGAAYRTPGSNLNQIDVHV